jgi:hypothetical protein
VSDSVVQLICDVIDESGRLVLFIFIVDAAIIVPAVLLALFALLLVRRAFLWLVRHTVNSVIVSAERKALR